jgi:hypothetical protein
MRDRDDPTRAIGASGDGAHLPRPARRVEPSSSRGEAADTPDIAATSGTGPRRTREESSRLPAGYPRDGYNRRPAASVIFGAVPGIRGCCVGDLQGTLLDQHGEVDRPSDVLLASATLLRELDLIGARFGLGEPDMVTSKGSQATRVIMYRGACTLAVDIDPRRPINPIESALREVDWQNTGDWVLTDQDIEYLPEQVPDAPSVSDAPPSATGPISAAAPASEVATTPALVLEECALLRRALIKGQLSSATRVAARLGKTPAPSVHPFGSIDTEPVLRPLLNAIANILSGDSSGGLANLETVRETAQIGPSLKWVAQAWSARASTHGPDGLDAAQVYAESSLRLAESLDAEARAVSMTLLAEIKINMADWEAALELIQTARGLFESVGDSREIASCWLLEARASAALSYDADSLRAAERAKSADPSWPPPVTFLVQRALGEGRIEDAERAQETLLSRAPIPSEAERNRRLIEHVRTGSVSAAAAAQYLELLDTPRGPKGLRKLQELVAGFPHVAQFRETLGWKLLRAGASKGAKTVFERLSTQDDLPDDLRASVLLGLGCLATAQSESEPASVKLRAAVNAAPRQSGTQPRIAVSTATVKPRRTDPMDLRVREMSLTPTPGTPRPTQSTSRLKAQGGPVFSGSLQTCGLPELLEVLRTGRKTGTLVCSSVEGIGAVHLRAGAVTGAVAPSSKELRHYLLARGSVTEPQLRLIEQLPERGKPTPLLELTLLEEGVVTTDQVRQAVRDQVLAAFVELIGWHEGQFAFDPETFTQPAPSGVEIELDPQPILLEAYATMDDESKAAR